MRFSLYFVLFHMILGPDTFVNVLIAAHHIFRNNPGSDFAIFICTNTKEIYSGTFLIHVI